MTKPLSGPEIAQQIGEQFPNAATDSNETTIFLRGEALLDVARFLKESLDLDYLNSITAVDYMDYFELTYLFTSLKKNHSLIVKVKCNERDDPKIPSIFVSAKTDSAQKRYLWTCRCQA